MSGQVLGRHLLVELYGCNRDLINHLELVREAMLEAARRSNATIVTDVFHRFNPHGMSGVVVIAESHIAIHTWPEHACASVDIFSCGDGMNPEIVAPYLKTVFEAKSVEVREFTRGRILETRGETRGDAQNVGRELS